METDKVKLSDDELKDVSAGSQCLPYGTGLRCEEMKAFYACINNNDRCYWKDGRCYTKQG
jgi:hypothetical protein